MRRYLLLFGLVLPGMAATITSEVLPLGAAILNNNYDYQYHHLGFSWYRGTSGVAQYYDIGTGYLRSETYLQIALPVLPANESVVGATLWLDVVTTQTLSALLFHSSCCGATATGDALQGIYADELVQPISNAQPGWLGFEVTNQLQHDYQSSFGFSSFLVYPGPGVNSLFVFESAQDNYGNVNPLGPYVSITTATPEPTSLALITLGLGLLCFRRTGWRHQRKGVCDALPR